MIFTQLKCLNDPRRPLDNIWSHFYTTLLVVILWFLIILFPHYQSLSNMRLLQRPPPPQRPTPLIRRLTVLPRAPWSTGRARVFPSSCSIRRLERFSESISSTITQILILLMDPIQDFWPILNRYELLKFFNYTHSLRTRAAPTRATLLLIGWISRDRDLLSRILAYWNHLTWQKIHRIHHLIFCLSLVSDHKIFK